MDPAMERAVRISSSNHSGALPVVKSWMLRGFHWGFFNVLASITQDTGVVVSGVVKTATSPFVLSLGDARIIILFLTMFQWLSLPVFGESSVVFFIFTAVLGSQHKIAIYRIGFRLKFVWMFSSLWLIG